MGKKVGRRVADRFNDILVSLHEKRYASVNKATKGPKGGARYELRESLAAETHPLTKEAPHTHSYERTIHPASCGKRDTCWQKALLGDGASGRYR